MLVEQAGPWGRKALTESRLDPGLAAALEQRCKELGVKVLLVKRPGRDDRRQMRSFLGWSRQADAFLEEVPLERPEALLELPLAGLAAGERPGLGSPIREPLYLVCTNSRRDACCARRGRPLVRALANRLPGRVWECSHVGGHRFAPNLLCFPDGLWFGRASVEAAEEYERGRILLEAFRGRSSFAAAVQAADWFVRKRDGFRGVDDLILERHDGDEVVFRAPAARYRVRVERGEAGRPRPVSCGEDKLERPPVWSLDAIEREGIAAGSR